MSPSFWSGILALGAAPVIAAAAPNEIKVFTDELARYREHTLEFHVNKASSARPTAENQATPLQIMPESSYGLRRNWELSFQLPFTIDAGSSDFVGYRSELQYVAPHDEDDGFYWGFNVELARNDPPGEASFWSAELIPILGYRGGRWHFVANPGADKGVYWGFNVELARNDPPGEASFWSAELIPILGYRGGRWHFVANPGADKQLSGSSRAATFQPAAKIAYQAFGWNSFGLGY